MTSEVERFPPTNGRVGGIVGLVVVALFLLVSVVDAGSDIAPVVVFGCLFVTVVIWVVLLRPAVRVEDGSLVLRGELLTRRLPLAAIDSVVVGPVLAVSVDGRRYTSAAIGRSRRQTRKDARDVASESGAESGPVSGAVTPASQVTPRAATEVSVAAFVEGRIRALVEQARLRREQPGAVRRAWAWPEIAALVGTGVATVVAVLS